MRVMLHACFKFDLHESKALEEAMGPFEILVSQAPDDQQAALREHYRKRQRRVRDEMRPRHIEEMAMFFRTLKAALRKDMLRWEQATISAPTRDGGLIANPLHAFQVLIHARERQIEACDESLALLAGASGTMIPLTKRASALVENTTTQPSRRKT